MNRDNLLKYENMDFPPAFQGLHPQLKRSLSFDDGLMIHHPLLVTRLLPSVNTEQIDELNSAFEQKRRLATKFKRARRFRDHIYLFERPYRLQAFIDLQDRLPNRWYWRLLGEIWTDSRDLHESQFEWRKLFASERPFRNLLMNRHERVAFAHLPELFPVYRAGHTDAGLNWTLDPKVAIRWVHRSNDKIGLNLFTAWAIKAQVIAYLDQLNERQVIVDSQALRYRRKIFLAAVDTAVTPIAAAKPGDSSGGPPLTPQVNLTLPQNELALVLWSIAIEMRHWDNTHFWKEFLGDLLFGAARMGISKITAVDVLHDMLNTRRHLAISRQVIMGTANSRYTSEPELKDRTGVKATESKISVNLVRLRGVIAKKQWTNESYIVDLGNTVRYAKRLHVFLEICQSAIEDHLNAVGIPYNADVLQEQIMDAACGFDLEPLQQSSSNLENESTQ